MNYNVLCIPEIGSFGIDYIVDTQGFNVKAGDLTYDYGADVVYKYIQTGSSAHEWRVETDSNYKELIKVSQEYTGWDGKDHSAIKMFIINLDYPKKEDSSGSTGEPGELKPVHAHINGLLPDHVVVGNDEPNEIYSLKKSIGATSIPVYIKDGKITPCLNFGAAFKSVTVNQTTANAALRFNNLNGTFNTLYIQSVNSSRAGLMTPALLNKLNGIDEKLQDVRLNNSTIEQTIRNDVDKKLSTIPTYNQINAWANNAAIKALENGIAAKWSAIARQITLDENGNIITINGAGFLTDESYSEMFAGYMDAEGRQKFATLIASVYKDELNNITSEITAAADKIYLKSYKEVAMGVYRDNSEELIAGLVANEDFISLVKTWTNVDGTAGTASITLDTPVPPTGKTLSRILLDADTLQTGDQMKAINLITQNLNEDKTSLNLSGFIAGDSFSGMFVSNTEYQDNKKQVQDTFKFIYGTSGVFNKYDENGKSIIFLDADDIRFRANATIGTYLGQLATLDESGNVILNPVQLNTPKSIDSILSGQATLGNKVMSIQSHFNSIYTSISELKNNKGETILNLDADKVIIGKGVNNLDPNKEITLSDVVTIEDGEITCKAATFTEGQRTLFKNLDEEEEYSVKFVGMPIYSPKDSYSDRYEQDYSTPYWYGEDVMALSQSMEYANIEGTPIKGEEDLYLAKDLWNYYKDDLYVQGTSPHFRITPNTIDSINSSNAESTDIIDYEGYYQQRLQHMMVSYMDYTNMQIQYEEINEDLYASDTFKLLRSTNTVITGSNVILPCRAEWVGRKVTLISMHSETSGGYRASYIIPENYYSDIKNVGGDSVNGYLNSGSMIGVFDGMVELCYLPKAARLSNTFEPSEYCWFITNKCCNTFHYYNGKIIIE